MLNLQNGSEERKMPDIHGSICALVSRFRFHIRHQTKHASLSESFISCQIHGLKWDVKPPKRIRVTEDAKYLRLDLFCRVTFPVSHSPLNKTRSWKNCQFYNGVSILNIGQSLGNDWLPVTNVKNWDIIFTTSVVEWNCNVTVAEWYKR